MSLKQAHMRFSDGVGSLSPAVPPSCLVSLQEKVVEHRQGMETNIYVTQNRPTFAPPHDERANNSRSFTTYNIQLSLPYTTQEHRVV
ncbi:hypothetical protein HL42_3273 [Trichophyton rubrum]|nr:hypothetical protein HL42_3273 [Trichophyton rubrum]